MPEIKVKQLRFIDASQELPNKKDVFTSGMMSTENCDISYDADQQQFKVKWKRGNDRGRYYIPASRVQYWEPAPYDNEKADPSAKRR